MTPHERAVAVAAAEYEMPSEEVEATIKNSPWGIVAGTVVRVEKAIVEAIAETVKDERVKWLDIFRESQIR